jgi:hypothetical protein
VKLVSLVLVIAAVPGACWPEAKYYGHLEVWNRTNGVITVVAPGSAAPNRDEIRVGPCGHAERDGFLISSFEVIGSTGEVILIGGGGGPDPDRPEPVYVVVERQEAGGAELSTTAPAALPPCD